MGTWMPSTAQGSWGLGSQVPGGVSPHLRQAPFYPPRAPCAGRTQPPALRYQERGGAASKCGSRAPPCPPPPPRGVPRGHPCTPPPCPACPQGAPGTSTPPPGQAGSSSRTFGVPWRVPGCDAAPPFSPGISPTVKKTEMDKSPFNSPSPQDSSPRLSSFTQHHRPVIAVHSGECPAGETEARSKRLSGPGAGRGGTGGSARSDAVGHPLRSRPQVSLEARTRRLRCISPPPPSSPRRPPPTSPTRPFGTRLISTRRTR